MINHPMNVLRSNRSQALLGALLLESALLASGAWLLTHTVQAAPAAEKRGPVRIALVSPPKPSVPKPPTPKPPPPKPKPKPPKPKPLPRPKPPPPKPHHVVHHAVPVPKPVPRTIPTPKPLPVPPPPPPPTPVVHTLPPQPATSNQLALFAARVHAAVQASLIYPISARVLGLTGRTKVGFTYRDGHVSGVRLLISCGYPALDRAALNAVRDARYPPPPAALASKTQTLTIWVRFKSSSSD